MKIVPMKFFPLLMIYLFCSFPVVGLEARCQLNLPPGAPPDSIKDIEQSFPGFTYHVLKWNAPEADFVLLPGLADGPQERNGEKEVQASIVFTVVAIMKDKGEVAFVYCEPGALPGPGPGDAVLPLSFVYSPRATYQDAFVSALPMKDIMRILLAVFQEEGFPILSTSTEFSFNNGSRNEEARHTGLTSHQLLCSGDCQTPPNKRLIEREAMFTMRVLSTIIRGKPGFEVFLHPIVVSRNSRIGGKWDLDLPSVAKQLSERMLKKISDRSKDSGKE